MPFLPQKPIGSARRAHAGADDVWTLAADTNPGYKIRGPQPWPPVHLTGVVKAGCHEAVPSHVAPIQHRPRTNGGDDALMVSGQVVPTNIHRFTARWLCVGSVSREICIDFRARPRHEVITSLLTIRGPPRIDLAF